MMCFGFRLILSVLALTGAFAQAAESAATIDSFKYPTEAAARVWVPMSGSLNALPDGAGLRLRCNFAGTVIERASWDKKARIDLSDCQGVRLEVWCDDPTPVSYFCLYFRSGNGWYTAPFYPEANGWNTIRIDKSQMKTEGAPAGWNAIDAIRLSAWRGQDQDTEFRVADLRKIGVLGEDALVAVIRPDSAKNGSGEQARSLEQATETVLDSLAEAEIGAAAISDSAVTSARLKGAKLVILPYNPTLPAGAGAALSAYAGGGGRLLVFYTVPEPLRAALNIAGQDHIRASRAGHFASVRPRPGALTGAPAAAAQQSWNISVPKLKGSARVLAEWADDAGKPSGQPAILRGTNWLLMTHVLLREDRSSKSRLLQAMAGELAPEIWQQVAQRRLSGDHQLASYRDYEEAMPDLERLAKSDQRALAALAAAKAARSEARKLLAGGNFARAAEKAQQAADELERTFCLAQKPLEGEFRAFWCHSAFGVKGIDWDTAVKRLAENGFNAVLPNMLWGGAAFYDSKVLPVAREAAEKGDQVRACLEACRKHGVQIHVWKVNWNLGSAAPREFVERMRAQKRLQADVRGKEEPWLCPSHPLNQQLEVDSMVELVRNYPLDGIHFDYIRYPDNEHCFCGGCRERFEQALGKKIAQWPADALAAGALRQQWLDFRRANITRVVQAVSDQARAINPKIKISAAVFRLWNVDRDGVGQDWKVWCDRGYLDFVCPMDYTPSNRRFESMLTQQLQWAGRVPCYPGLGLSASSSRYGADRAIEQINITRRHKTGGFVIFNYGVKESEEILPKLGLGITARQ